MKKILLLLIVLPIFGVSQDLPTYYTTLEEGEKYIDRDKQLERDIKSLEDDIRTGNIEFIDIFPEVIEYYNKYGEISEEMYFEYLEESQSIGDGWVEGFIPDYVSSTLSSQGNNSYDKSNLGDVDGRTAWVEGVEGYGIGQYLETFVLGDGVIRHFSILNGYQKSIKSWKDNSRVKSFKVYIDNIPICILELEDRMGRQVISFGELLPEDFETFDASFKMRLEILEVYPGERWKDVCISGISISFCYC